MHKYALRVAVASGLVIALGAGAAGAHSGFWRDSAAGEGRGAERGLDADAGSDEGSGGESEAEAETEGKEGPAGADDWFAVQRTYPLRSVDIGQRLSAARTQAATLAGRPGRLAAASWQPLGPANVGGRVTDLVADPARPDTVYAAAATGGVWKSTDAGATFARAWSATGPASVGALAMTPNGVLYAGTGEGNPGGGSVTFPGNGVYRSADGGATWTPSGLAGTDRIGRIAPDPSNSQRIFAAAAGSLFVPGGARGLYRTTDGGTTWQKVLAGATATTGAIDVAIDPGNPLRIYATMWDHHRQPSGREYGGTGSGLYRSTDGGATWTRLGGGLPAASADLGRMGVAVAKSDPNRLYVIAADASGDFSGFWTSANGGDSWAKLTTTSAVASSQSTFGWWFGRLWVDPAAPRHVFVAGVSLVESSDAGATWRSSSAVHADQHAMAWAAGSAGRVYLGDDGGVYRSQSGGSVTGAWTKSASLPVNQFYSVAVSRQSPGRVLGGAQDNGSLRSWGTPSWNSINGGDGTTTLIDPSNENKVYACSQYGACSRSTTGGSGMSAFGSTTSDRRGWLAPVVFDPSNPAVMYYGGNRLNRSANSAASWSPVSPDLTHGDGGTGGYPFGTITAVAVAKSNGAVIYAGTDDGRVWITRNTGGSWTEITAGLPTRWMTSIAVDPANANVAYVTVSGYRNGDNGAHVWRTADGGATWRDVSGNLPNAPVNRIVLDPRTPAVLYVASDVGIFSSGDGGTSWQAVGSGLPAVPVADLDVVASGSATVLTAATFGLSMYRLTAP